MTVARLVNISEIRVAKSPTELICLGLGSCVAVVLYDPKNKIGGLAHVMLPDSREVINLTKPGKFADTAISCLLTKMQRKGAVLSLIHAKIFGGADMFALNHPACESIGALNVKAVMKQLKHLGIPLFAKDTGGNTGRSIFFLNCASTFLIFVAVCTDPPSQYSALIFRGGGATLIALT